MSTTEFNLSEFWRRKVEGNVARDQRSAEALTALAWRLVRLWKHEVKRDFEGCVG